MGDTAGSTPSAGANLLAIGSANLRVRRESFSSTPIPFDVALSAMDYRPCAEVVSLDDKGDFEVKLNSYTATSVGFGLSNTPTGMTVAAVLQGSEAMRIGIRLGDVLLSVRGFPEAKTVHLVGQLIQRRPAWLHFHRPCPASPVALVEFEHSSNGVLRLDFYQPGRPGSGSKHTTEELQRLSPQAEYLKKIERESHAQVGDGIDAALVRQFIKTDTIDAAQRLKGGSKERIDVGQAKREGKAIEPKLRGDIHATALPMLAAFIGGDTAAYALHVKTGTDYVTKKYFPSLVQPAKNRLLIAPLLNRSMHFPRSTNISCQSPLKKTKQLMITGPLFPLKS